MNCLLCKCKDFYFHLKSASGLRNEGLKYMPGVASANMSTVSVAVATVKRAMVSIVADGV
jgi:hypothetical protein